jgi:diguanylate cyclase (GGDEF)-like protein
MQLGLRQRFLLAVFLAVIPALGLVLFNAAEGRRLAADQAERSVVEWSGVITNYQRDLEHQAKTLVAVLARDSAVFNPNHAVCNEHFAELLFNAIKEPENFSNFVAADLNGNIYCSARQGTVNSMHIRDRVYFRKVLETKSVFVDNYVLGKISNVPVIPIAGPILNADGELRGVMLVTVNLSWIAKTMSQRLPPGAVLKIYDSKGTVLVQLPDHDSAVGKSGFDFEKVRTCGSNKIFSGSESNGTEYLYACSLIPYGEHAFHVAIGVPRAQAYAEADHVLQRSLALFCLITFVVMGSARIFGNSLIIKEIQRLMMASREIASGNLSTRMDARRTDEIGQLGMAFNEMAAALEGNAKDALAREDALAKANSRLEKLSTTDGLTGLWNRAHINHVLEQELNSHLRHGNPCSLIMIDVDYFKVVNDTHGHQLGDSVLIEFAKLLSDGTRVTDAVGRWGGEEFIVVCPDTDITAAVALAEKLRKLVESHVFPVVGSKTGSFGVASFCASDEFDTAVSRADAALYRAKRNGRNKVEIGT